MLLWVLLLAPALACDLRPGGGAGDKAPGDNHYRLLVNGDVERYQPEQRYVVTLVGSRTHDVVQQFSRFRLVAEPLDPAASRAPSRVGQFQLFADTLTKFDEECSNAVVESDDLPKTEVAAMWRAPPAGAGCVLLKAMVYENASRWFAEDGQLTRRVCEDARAAPTCCACDDAQYKMTFEGLWSAATHPKDFPVAAAWLTHFSDVVGATHGPDFSFWGEGKIATDGFRSLAEWGSTGLLELELRQQGHKLRSLLKAQGLWYPKVNSNTSAVFMVDRKRHQLSLASMFGPSPDWVVGVSGLELCRADCSWEERAALELRPYDAGTDSGVSYLSPNAETIPREKMYRITPMYPEDPRAPFYDPRAATVPPLARLYLTREKLVSRGCDEETLQQLLTVEESTKDEDRPECAVSEWGAWSACSVSCGKGLRARTRRYLRAQEAAAAAAGPPCAAQLVGKEMCVAEVAECEGSAAPMPSLAAPPVEDNSGVCSVGPWGAWSECSVTCGVGQRVRRRHFLNRMGIKKCPLVQIEESRKCMEPECTDAEPELADPSCPTTEWSGWSPCSASCGRGLRLRTRLLLVPAARQRACAARLPLLQQAPCSDTPDCRLDMRAAKEICMSEAEMGPCRGVYERWAYVAAKGMCAPFQYGGCRGNRNNFLTREDCLETCSVVGGGPAAAAAAPAQSNSVPVASAPTTNNTHTASAPLFPASPCELGPWSEWGPCSVSCGVGYQERRRALLTPAEAGAAPCSARLLRRRRCFRPC